MTKQVSEQDKLAAVYTIEEYYTNFIIEDTKVLVRLLENEDTTAEEFIEALEALMDDNTSILDLFSDIRYADVSILADMITDTFKKYKRMLAQHRTLVLEEVGAND